jgi:glucosylglycerate synthase
MMATSTSIPDATETRTSGGLLVLLAAMPPEQTESVLAKLTASFPAEQLIIATREESASESHPDLRFVPAPETGSSWSLTAEDFVQAHELASGHQASAILILGPESGSLDAAVLRDLSAAVLDESSDLAVPRYNLSARAGLVNSAILYPLSRSLFATRARYPLAIDLGLSPRMAERLAIVAHRYTNLHQPGALVWPVSEACVAGYAIAEVEGGPRALPQPAQPDLNSILPLVTGSLFADVEKKAAYWQRARQLPSARAPLPLAHAATAEATDVVSMIQGFRLAYSNLLEIWSLVLPPNALLGLKRLSLTEPSEFRMPDSLWARIVFDFTLAYRLHTINRGHLLGALIPLYLAWVASHINLTASGTDPEQHVEATAAAFESEKPYLLSRWRWPDRFNP